MTIADAKEEDEVISGIFSINSIPASVLFDSGASRLFVSSTFSILFVIPLSPLDQTLDVETAKGQLTTVKDKCDGCSITIDERTFPLSLIPIGIHRFDVVIGIDWLSTNRAEIVCSKRWSEFRYRKEDMWWR